MNRKERSRHNRHELVARKPSNDTEDQDDIRAVQEEIDQVKPSRIHAEHRRVQLPAEERERYVELRVITRKHVRDALQCERLHCRIRVDQIVVIQTDEGIADERTEHEKRQDDEPERDVESCDA